MKHQVTLKVDGTIEIAALAKALAGIGLSLSSDREGDLIVRKRRKRPTLKIVEPEKK
jgi:hypothetical protein